MISFSIAAALITLGMKSAAYFLTGSVGLLSDALEACVNLFAAVTAYVTLWYAARPVDATHTYGHEKIEYFSSGLEGVLILIAGFGIIATASQRFFDPVCLNDVGLGSALTLAASLVNFLVARRLIRAGKAHQSIVLEADGQHLMTDVWTSLGIVGGLGIVAMTGWDALDPIIAIVVAINIVWTSLKLIRRSFNGLMDHALPEKEQATFRAAVQAQLPERMMFHALRTCRRAPAALPTSTS